MAASISATLKQISDDTNSGLLGVVLDPIALHQWHLGHRKKERNRQKAECFEANPMIGREIPPDELVQHGHR